MADVLLTHSNHIYFDRKQVEKMQPYPPLGTLIAAAVLRDAGLDVALFDTNLNNPMEGFEGALERHSPGLVAVVEDDFNFLSKMCLGRNREVAFGMAEAARRRRIACAVHGSDATDHLGAYLDAGFDFILMGEVENTLLELAQGVPPEAIDGLVRRDAGVMRRNPPRAIRPTLDNLPMPAWELIDGEQYRHAWKHAHGYFSLNLISSRGCPYRCNWCAKPIYGSRYRVRSPRQAAEEMRHLKTAFGPDHVWFADDIFALSAKWTLAFADEVEALNARIPFKMQSRCDLMTRGTVDALRRAGCSEVWLGAESGSQRILDAMEKGTRVEDLYAARENLRRNGIRACFFLQFGYPGEGWSEIEATVQMVRELRPDDIGVSISYPLPRTKFFENVVGQLGRKANWSESGDLFMMFQGAYSSDFYRALADALHLEVRQRPGPQALREAWSRVHQLRQRPARQIEVPA
jgi:anaerobic magnesium-protoporphyrin IX monomethyl ester cyclase